METMELTVTGMTCDGCERSVGNAIGRLSGVSKVEADHRTGRVLVEAEGPIDGEAVRDAVEDAGYDVAPPGRGLPMA